MLVFLSEILPTCRHHGCNTDAFKVLEIYFITVQSLYNAIFGVHKNGSCYKLGFPQA